MSDRIRNEFIKFGRAAGLPEDQIQFCTDIGETIYIVMTATITTTCAALEMYDKIEAAKTLVVMKLDSFLNDHKEEFINDPQKFLSLLVFWVRDTIQDFYYQPKKETK